jgi:hypothetical protein
LLQRPRKLKQGALIYKYNAKANEEDIYNLMTSTNYYG